LAIFGCWYLKWAQLLDGSISLKFSMETSLESESVEPLIDFLAFLVQKLRPKINKIINYQIFDLFVILLFLGHNF